ncbi:MAG: sialidase family protein [Verrucomicrobia bacterium]|nr:sialidase family protein [Verrucomicrobiota bacterium]
MKLHETMAALMFCVLATSAMKDGVEAAEVKPSEKFELVVAPIGAKNPRNSEAAIIQRKDGSLLLAWTEFYASQGADHGPARIAGKSSSDGGRTWGEKFTLIENDGGCNVMEVNLLRLRNGDMALFHCQKNTESSDCRIMTRTSADDGKTWSAGKQLSPAGKYTGLTNGRCIRLRTGRILLEAWEGGDSYCVLSDDDGNTWRDSQRVQPAKGKCYEPACIELSDGRVMMLMRTGLGCQYKSLSKDGGQTWTEPVPTPLAGTAAPVAITRIPTSGDLLAIWNHNPGAKKRNPLTAAISKDEGETWTSFRNVEDAPTDDAWAYPAVTWVGDRALITYFNYKGGLSLKLRSLPATWFYQGNARVAAAQPAEGDRLRAEFLKMCDAGCAELNTPERTAFYYHDSYAVRALAVAYDLTSERKYLEVCRRWSDRMIEYQNDMTPKGAYWMRYGRKPGETKGDWYIGDCSSIAMGVLATAARCESATDRQRYMDSVMAYAKLVMDNYVRPTGGITDGVWKDFDGEWWCSSGVFGSLAFLLYAETGDVKYLKVGRGALDWLNKMGFRNAEHIGFKEAAPSVVMYVFEGFSAGMAHLDLQSPLGKASVEHIRAALDWMRENQRGRGANCPWNYSKQWGCKLGGLPFHQYVYARYLPDGAAIAAAADQELRYLASQVFAAGEPKLTQLVCFTMMSYAEKLSPGAIYRKTRK